MMNEMNNDYRNYRDDYRDDYRNYRDYRDYDLRGGKVNRDSYRDYRNYRNYREDFYTEMETCMDEMRDHYRKLEDLAEMAEGTQEKNLLMKIAQKNKENYNAMKQMFEK